MSVFGVELKLARLNWGKRTKDRVLTIALVLAVLGVLSSLVYIAVIPRVGETFSEFYILGEQGKFGDYPDKLKVGDEGKVYVGIVNHERMEANYSIMVLTNSNTTALAGPVVLSDGQNWEGEVGFRVTLPGEHQKVEFLLYRNSEGEPYKELHLWIDVAE